MCIGSPNKLHPNRAGSRITLCFLLPKLGGARCLRLLCLASLHCSGWMLVVRLKLLHWMCMGSPGKLRPNRTGPGSYFAFCFPELCAVSGARCRCLICRTCLCRSGWDLSFPNLSSFKVGSHCESSRICAQERRRLLALGAAVRIARTSEGARIARTSEGAGFASSRRLAAASSAAGAAAAAAAAAAA